MAGIYHYYGRTPVVEDMNLTLLPGQVLGLLGPNGAGKSTTMQLMTTALVPARGRVWLAGIDALKAPRLARRQVGYLPERPPVYRELNVLEYLGYCAVLRGLRGRARASAVASVLERCDLGSVRRRIIGQLSHGYRQRLGLAQALLHDPAIVVLDEPTSGLDPLQLRQVRELIRSLPRHCGVVLSTHVLGEVQALCSHVQIIHQGRVVHRSALDRAAKALVVGLNYPPDLASLAGLPGVTAVEALGEGRFRLALGANGDPKASAEAVAARGVAAGWGLWQLVTEGGARERVFVQLTAGGALPETRGGPC
ncbi:MAG: ABC transporter ATP-binding protein [Candidatus Competibacterales bacterium]